jgi:hypothetical protein
MMNPIRQDQDYHRFADARTLLGVENGADVLSNLPLVVVGAMGLGVLWRNHETLRAYWLFFFAAASAGIGSAYYHLSPDDGRMVWDRLPIAIAFMALLSAAISDRLDAKAGNAILIPLTVLGAVSVLWWAKVDDLTPYLLVQYGALAAIVALCARGPLRYSTTAATLLAAIIYGTAKICELNDRLIFVVTGGWVSGHTLKHLLAALALYCIVWALQRGRSTDA